MSMPIMDGFEATREIRRLEFEQKLATCPRSTFIVALTGLASASDEEAAFDAGVDMYITKPLAFPRLSALLRNCEEGNLKTDRSSDDGETSSK
jgi:CheY-like chemotaxis protein